jgi:putative RNA 2'-phosphotransferase
MARDGQNDRRTALSKFLSYHLRHDPQGLGLELGPGGWVPVANLLAGAARIGRVIDRQTLEDVVATCTKKRYAFDPTGTLIRANQGHSVPVDLQLEPRIPPPILFHGTAERFVDSILRERILKQARHHVHLSPDIPTARVVGARHGKPVILEVAVGQMHSDGQVFYCSANGVWLVDSVPARYLRVAV